MHYSADAIRRSLGHFVLGKSVTAVSAVVLLLALAHQLPKAEFALYASLQALVLVVGALTSFGLNQSTLRYIPEMRAHGQNAAMYALIWRTARHRLVLCVGAFSLVAITLPWLDERLGPTAHDAWILLYLVVGTVRLTSQFFSSAMESLLWPKISQYALAVAAVIKLMLVLALWRASMLSLPAVVLLELAAELLAFVMLTIGLRRRQKTDPQAAMGDPDWAQTRHARLSRYGRWNYATTLATQLATSAPYRLMAPLVLGPERAAVLALVYGLTDLLQRFLPARMARLLLRSLIVGRQAQAQAAAQDGPLAMSLRLNLGIVALALACALAAGSGALAMLTGGRYTGVGTLLSMVIVVIGLDVCRSHLDLLASVHERVRASVAANLGLGVGVGSAFALAERWGLLAMPLGAAIGQLVAISLYLHLLRDLSGHRMIAARALAFVMLAALAGAAAQIPEGWHWAMRLVLAMLLVAGAAAWTKPFTRADLRRLSGRRMESPVEVQVTP